MPVGEHKDWCAILRGQKELAERGIGSLEADTRA
jgi:hypothetical protein